MFHIVGPLFSDAELAALTDMAAVAHELGLEVHAGHGLTYDTVAPIAALPPREPIGNAVAWLRDWAEENDLHLGPETNMPRWEGESPDYGLAVSVLLEAGCDGP